MTSSDEVCVAAIDIQRQLLVRPLRWNGRHWPGQFALAGWLRPGAVVRQVIRKVQTGRGFPHASNDLLLQNDLEPVARLAPNELYEALLPTAQDRVITVFPPLRDNAYVFENSVCPSLGSLRTDAVEAYVNQYKKIRVKFVDADRVRYDCSLTDYEARHDGAAAVDRLNRSISNVIGTGGDAILRLGLANAWDRDGEYDPRRCFLPVNGIIVPE